jgi:hypothetical protein
MGRHGRLLAVLALAAWAGEASGAVVGRERAEAWELLLKYLVTTMAPSGFVFCGPGWVFMRVIRNKS